MQTGVKEMSLCMFASHVNFLSKYLVHKLLEIITRFFDGFIKIPVLLKICYKKVYFVFCLVSGLLTTEFLLKEKLLSGNKTFGYTLRLVILVTAQMSPFSQIAQYSTKIIFVFTFYLCSRLLLHFFKIDKTCITNRLQISLLNRNVQTMPTN